jgi:hypothetical protein
MSFSPTLALKNSLDENWVQLMIAARSMGISKQEVLLCIRQLQKQNKRKAR